MSQRFNLPRIALQPSRATYSAAHASEETIMETEKLLTKEKANAICEKIAKGLEKNEIVGSAAMIAYAMKKAWSAGFEQGANIRSRNQSDRIVKGVVSQYLRTLVRLYSGRLQGKLYQTKILFRDNLRC
jgi:flagellar biosynthesis/type III secretory pathway protein FliH